MKPFPSPVIPPSALGQAAEEMGRGVYHDDLVRRAYETVGTDRDAACVCYRQMRAAEIAWGIGPESRGDAPILPPPPPPRSAPEPLAEASPPSANEITSNQPVRTGTTETQVWVVKNVLTLSILTAAAIMFWHADNLVWWGPFILSLAGNLHFAYNVAAHVPNAKEGQGLRLLLTVFIALVLVLAVVLALPSAMKLVSE